MKKNLKWTIVLLLLVSLIALMASCGQTNSGNTDTGTGTESTTAQPEESNEETTSSEDILYAIVQNGTSEFQIVRPDGAPQATVNAAVAIKTAVQTLTDVSIKLRDDFVPRGEEQDRTTFEILVGFCNYPETREAMNSLSYGSTLVTVSGRKIIVAGWSDEAITAAAEELIAILQGGVTENKELIFKAENLSASSVVNDMINDVPVVENETLSSVYDCNDDTYELIFDDAKLENYQAYLEKLQTIGYTEYSAHTTGKVHFATYTSSDFILNAYYQESYKDIRVIIEKFDEKQLPPKTADYTKVCTTQVAQVGVEYDYSSSKPASDSQNGMLYIWRLEDGTFMLLDSGFNYSVGSKVLYESLCNLAVDKNNIVISCWMISHMHGDHVGAMTNFLNNYMAKVKIKSILYNMPTEAQCAVTNEGWGNYKKLLPLMQATGAILYKATPGEIYQFANAQIEILYTLEMYAPKDLAYFNTSTVVYKVSFGEFDMMMLGDCSEPANAILCKNYATALESEVVQVAHHGYQGGSTALYRNINPIYVLWPAGSKQYNKATDSAKSNSGDRSAYFFLSDTRVKTIYPALDDVAVFTIEKDTGFIDYTLYEDSSAFTSGTVKASAIFVKKQ